MKHTASGGKKASRSCCFKFKNTYTFLILLQQFCHKLTELPRGGKVAEWLLMHLP